MLYCVYIGFRVQKCNVSLKIVTNRFIRFMLIYFLLTELENVGKDCYIVSVKSRVLKSHGKHNHRGRQKYYYKFSFYNNDNTPKTMTLFINV